MTYLRKISWNRNFWKIDRKLLINLSFYPLENQTHTFYASCASKFYGLFSIFTNKLNWNSPKTSSSKIFPPLNAHNRQQPLIFGVCYIWCLKLRASQHGLSRVAYGCCSHTHTLLQSKYNTHTQWKVTTFLWQTQIRRWQLVIWFA